MIVVPYIEENCKRCRFAGDISEALQDSDIKGMRYINCLCDSEGYNKCVYRHDKNDLIKFKEEYNDG
jgi:hypothetical protein